jgi:hypothetical protein
MGSGGSGGGGINFFGLRSGKGGLVGTFYDLKQTPDRKPTRMMGDASEDTGKFNTRSKENMEYLENVRDFARVFSESRLSRYYRAKQQLVTYQILIPPMSAGGAPAAFSVEKEVKPRRWLVHYRGTVIAPRDGQFRFVGRCDDILVVRCNGRNVLDGSFPVYQVDREMNEETVGETAKANKGKWIHLNKDQEIDLEIVIGETPGGSFWGYLLIEEKGVPAPAGGLPLFQVRSQPVPPNKWTSSPPLVFGIRDKPVSALDALSQ